MPLQLIVGYGFLAHGYAKLARGPDDFIGILHAIGMPFAFFLGWATISSRWLADCSSSLGLSCLSPPCP